MSQKLGFFHLIFFLFCSELITFGQLSAEFEVIYISQCPPGIINLVNKSTGFTSCKWVFGNGNSSESRIDTLSQVYPNAGDYTITLTVFDGVNEISKSKNIKIYREPKANFTTSISQGCIPMLVTYTQAAVIGDAPITEYYWDFRNGMVIKDLNPTITYNTVGQYDVLLRVTDNNGCINFIEKENTIKTYLQPIANFQANPAFACTVPASISFTNQTISDLPVNYKWQFGNGLLSTEVNTGTNYDQQNVYQVKLIAVNNSGCADTVVKPVAVQDFIESKFEMYNSTDELLNNNDTVCKGIYKFKNTTIPSNLFHWVLNGKTISITDSIAIYLTKPGWNTISLAPNNSGGCTESVEKRLYVNTIVADFEISDIYCVFPLTVNFTNLSNGAVSYSWKLAQGNSSTLENPQIILNDIYNAGDYIDFWPNYYYENTLIVTSELGCIDSISKNIVFRHPVARLTADKVQGCVPLEITFIDTSATSSLKDRKLWIFDDNSSSSDIAAHNTHTYLSGGDYEAKLIIENERGCRDTSDIFMIYAGEKLYPDFDFSPATACYNDTITFTDKTERDDVIDYWSYSSSANIFSECENEPDPKLSLQARYTGYHNLTLEVGYNGCISDTTFENVLKINGPIASFESLLDCGTPKKATFKSSLDQVTSYKWDFGDGFQNTIDAYPIHNYTKSGDYKVKLTAYNSSSGCEHQMEELVKIRQIKAAIAFDTIACVGDAVLLDASASKDYINECSLEGFQWTFGDGSAPRLTSQNTKIIYCYERGKFPVQLIATDINGCSDSVSQNIHIFQPIPLMSVDEISGCSPSFPVNFKNISTDTTITNFTWIFGDGFSVDNFIDFEHVYESDKESTFLSMLIAYDKYGCSNTVSQQLDIFKPNAGFSSNKQDLCLGEIIQFNTIYPMPDSAHWYYGNSLFYEKINRHTFNDTGNFSVTHTIFKDHCIDSVVIKNYISVEEASALIEASDTVAACYPQTILFKHINKGNDVVSGLWNFNFKGHTSPGYSDSVFFSYSLPGEFYPFLEVRTKNGCIAKQSIKITVNGPYAEFSISDSYPCKGQPVNFEMTVEKDVYEQLWDFGDGLASTEKSPTYAYSSIDTFIMSLTVSDINGCTPPANYETIVINQVKSDFLFPGNDSAFCIDETLNLKNNSVGASSYIWHVDDSENSQQFEPSDISMHDADTYTLSLEVSDKNNCSDTSSRSFIVYPLPIVLATATDSICRSKDLAYLYVSTDTNSAVLWSPGLFIDKVNSISTTATPEYSTRFMVVVTDTIGCVNSDSVDVFVHQFPEISRYPESDTTILVGEDVKLIVRSDLISEFLWSTNKFTGQNLSDTIVVRPLEGSIYTVNVKDICFENIVEFPVNVREIYTVELPDVFTPNGDGVNDKIYVRGGGIKELLEFRVFNRYGNLVYTSSDIKEGWDGNYKGKLQNPDVYTYFVRVKTYHDEEVSARGSFNLVY